MRLTKHSQPKDTVSIAGWLFADLLLGLSMFFLVSNSVGFKPIITITPTITSTNTVTPTSTPTKTKEPTRTITPTPITSETPGMGSQGLEMEPVSCEFAIDAAFLLAGDTPSNQVKRFVKEQLDKCYGEDKDRVAGFVLTLGYHRDIVGIGYKMAARTNAIIKEVMPEMFGRVQSEAFGAFRQDKSEVRIWIRAYFVTSDSKKENE